MTTQVAGARGMRKVVITRSRRGNQELARRLHGLGFETIPLDTIEFLPPDDWSVVDESLSRLPSFDWLLLTSPTGVEFFLRRMRWLRLPAPWRGRPAVAAVGKATAYALQERGIGVDFIPSEYLTAALIEELPRERGKELLMLRADNGDPSAAAILENRGFRVRDIMVYRTVVSANGRPDPRSLWEAGAVLFASASAVEASVGSAIQLRHLPAVCIGPVTAEAAKKHGFERTITATTHTVDGLVEALATAAGEVEDC